MKGDGYLSGYESFTIIIILLLQWLWVRVSVRDWLFELSTVQDEKRERGSQQWRLFGDNAFGPIRFICFGFSFRSVFCISPQIIGHSSMTFRRNYHVISASQNA